MHNGWADELGGCMKRRGRHPRDRRHGVTVRFAMHGAEMAQRCAAARHALTVAVKNSLTVRTRALRFKAS